MKLEFIDGILELSVETISYFNLLKSLFEDDDKATVPLENVSSETFTNLLKWLHGEEVIIDDNMINLVNFFNMAEPYKTRFCTEIADYLLEEPRLLPKDIYISLLKVDPGRLFLFAEKYFSDEEKDYLKTFMTRPENLGNEDKFNCKVIVYDSVSDRKTVNAFLATNSDSWVYICDDLVQLINAKNIIVDLPIIHNYFYNNNYNISNLILLTKQIGKMFLNNCISLKRFKLPETVTRVENSFLLGCSSLTELELPGTVVQIGDHFL